VSKDQFGRRSMILGVPGVLASQQRAGEAHKKEDEEEVSPAEDLMREHGVLKRLCSFMVSARTDWKAVRSSRQTR
jgi:hypothetical protein